MEHRHLYRTVCDCLDKGKCVRIATVVAEGRLKDRFLIHDSGERAPVDLDHNSDIIYTETIQPPSRLLILGGGHVAQCLADFAAKCDFKVWIADDREEFACRSLYQTADNILNDTFEESIRQTHLTSGDYVVVMTRGHQYDKECLRTILKGCRPAWIGMMSSGHRADLMRKMLSEEGYDQKAIEMIRMPVGLKIGSVTPAEIAVSILAELISVRHTLAAQCQDPSEAEADILRMMLSKSAYVEVSVLGTKGSSPRKNGARMIVWPDGHIDGSIGGGLAEAEAMQKAMQMMGSDAAQVMHVQMSVIPDDIHDEMMPCGGSMEILLRAVKKASV